MNRAQRTLLSDRNARLYAVSRTAQRSGLTNDEVEHVLDVFARERLDLQRPGDRRMTEAGAYRLREANNALQKAHMRKLKRIDSLRKQITRLEELNARQAKLIGTQVHRIDELELELKNQGARLVG